jgi:hypothetical protein
VRYPGGRGKFPTIFLPCPSGWVFCLLMNLPMRPSHTPISPPSGSPWAGEATRSPLNGPHLKSNFLEAPHLHALIASPLRMPPQRREPLFGKQVNMSLRLGFTVIVLLICGGTSIWAAFAVADSQVDFSDTQGLNNWYYGYIRPDVSSSFTLLPNYYSGNSGEWDFGSNHWVSGFNWINGTSMHPNGVYSSSAVAEEIWTVRRWVSEVDGNVTISGFMNCPGNSPLGDDGVLGEIWLDNQTIWSRKSLHESTAQPFLASAYANVGSTIDFVLKPNHSDISDRTVWTAQITAVPEPSALVPLGVFAFGLCTYARRRK